MSSATHTPELHWLDDGELEIDGQRYTVTGDIPKMHELESSAERLVLAKPRHMLEHLQKQSQGRRADHVVELGIFKGGSTAFLQQVLSPKKLVAVDVAPEPVQALEAFVASRSLEDVVRLHYGVDQADQAGVEAIIDLEFPAVELDLVIDDASHQYAESRASFETLFPRLRPGGRYILENWAWAHVPDEFFQRDDGLRADKPALTNLVVEAMLIMGSFPDIVREVRVDHSVAEFVRGERPLPNRIEMSRLYLNRGRLFRPLL